MTIDRRAFLSASALVLAASACSAVGGATDTAQPAEREGPLSDADFASLVRDAKAEGKVTFYCVPGEETMRTWVGPFQDEYGIQVEIYRATVSDIYRRFSEESSAGRHLADVVSMSVPSYIQDSVDQGWAVRYRTRNHDHLDQKLITAEAGYPMYAVITSIAWNENEVSAALQERLVRGDYTALLDEELSGRVGIVGPTAGGTQLGTHVAIVDDQNLGWSFLEDLKAADAAVFESSVPFVANDLASGEYAAGIGVPDAVAVPRIYEGAPVRLGYPDPAPSSMHQFFVSANAPHGAAARLFLEWGTSLEAQDALAEVSGGLVGHREWRDQRAIRTESWYQPPAGGIDVAWQRDLSLDDSDQFIEEWLDRLG
ncbi:ABC transporter substrate-binding protein [Actinophytocola gossypii]|uniref:Extracellular solute-binding protein n=1 Tax=Actinophytocola gossypii TaxID=2812003 RepID=A0ABT2JDN3_9PSEU|nr:extracellular solute-binding protein [Actinophytocola gossypii]MCT2585886.1 extracellular solute-binding protein [Actinophytocola gossypii]